VAGEGARGGRGGTGGRVRGGGGTGGGVTGKEGTGGSGGRGGAREAGAGVNVATPADGVAIAITELGVAVTMLSDPGCSAAATTVGVGVTTGAASVPDAIDGAACIVKEGSTAGTAADDPSWPAVAITEPDGLTYISTKDAALLRLRLPLALLVMSLLLMLLPDAYAEQPNTHCKDILITPGVIPATSATASFIASVFLLSAAKSSGLATSSSNSPSNSHRAEGSLVKVEEVTVVTEVRVEVRVVFVEEV